MSRAWSFKVPFDIETHSQITLKWGASSTASSSSSSTSSSHDLFCSCRYAPREREREMWGVKQYDSLDTSSGMSESRWKVSIKWLSQSDDGGGDTKVYSLQDTKKYTDSVAVAIYPLTRRRRGRKREGIMETINHCIPAVVKRTSISNAIQLVSSYQLMDYLFLSRASSPHITINFTGNNLPV